jgi:hypothetical protein
MAEEGVYAWSVVCCHDLVGWLGEKEEGGQMVEVENITHNSRGGKKKDSA